MEALNDVADVGQASGRRDHEFFTHAARAEAEARLRDAPPLAAADVVATAGSAPEYFGQLFAAHGCQRFEVAHFGAVVAQRHAVTVQIDLRPFQIDSNHFKASSSCLDVTFKSFKIKF